MGHTSCLWGGQEQGVFCIAVTFPTCHLHSGVNGVTTGPLALRGRGVKSEVWG